MTSEASSSVLNAGFVHFMSCLLIDENCNVKNHRPRPNLGSVMELRRATTLPGRRRRPLLKGLGWALVAALSCFIVAVAAGDVVALPGELEVDLRPQPCGSAPISRSSALSVSAPASRSLRWRWSRLS